MFTGYGFFDYKYNIAGYSGQDSSIGQIIYRIAAIVIVALLLIIFRKTKRENVEKYIKIAGIAITAFYITKTTWESIYDIPRGGFNLHLLPFDNCSIVMYSALIAGFAKGKLKEIATCWLCTGGVVGGISTLVELTAFGYYPFFTFGAFYSMIWHIFMIFTGLFLFVTGYIEPNFKTLLNGFIFHIIVSVPIIIFDYVMGMDFMFYLHGVSVVEGLSEKLYAAGVGWLTTIVMFITYFITFAIVVYVPCGIKKIIALFKNKNKRIDKTTE